VADTLTAKPCDAKAITPMRGESHLRTVPVLAEDTAAIRLTYRNEPDPNGPGSFRYMSNFVALLR
jgi:hypothetical protein